MLNIRYRFIVYRIILCLLLVVVIEGDGEITLSANDTVSWDTQLAINNVRIGPDYFEVPLNRIFLIRKGTLYGAVKLTSYWKGKIKYSEYTTYDCWFQQDGTGDFKKKNVEYENKTASNILIGLGRFSFNFGKDEIRCGPFRLWWPGKDMVYLFGVSQEPGDYGIELAPTKWINITEINVFDPKLKWYRYDLDRSRKDIPVDKLW